MRIGYARTSDVRQQAGLEAQERILQAVGIDKLFSEQLSSVDVARPQLSQALDFARKGDTLVVTKIDRLARSVADLLNIERQLDAKGVALQILDPAIDTGTPTGRLMFNMVAAIAQFERELMLERQREGIAKAAREGKYKGRQPTARAKTADVLRLSAEGLSAPKIAAQLGISERSVFRILAEARRG